MSLSKSLGLLSLTIATFSLVLVSFTANINTFAGLGAPGRFYTTDILNLREEPCGKIIGSVNKNSFGEAFSYKSNTTCKLTINGKTTDHFFWQVKMNDGKTGFLDAEYLTVPATDGIASISDPKYYNFNKFATIEILNLRETPCGKIIGTVQVAKTGTAYSNDNNVACKISANGETTDHIFVKVKMDDGRIGYLDGRYLVAGDDNSSGQPKKTVTKTVRTGGADLGQ
jgi:hypothetical protein